MSLTVRQASQVSAQFKQQLDAFQTELDNNDSCIERLRELFKTCSPQMDALSNSLSERQSELKQIRGMCETTTEQLSKISQANRFVDEQTVQSSRLYEALASSTGLNKVTIVPSFLTENNGRNIEGRAIELDQRVSLASELVGRLNAAAGQNTWDASLEEISSLVNRK